MTIQWIRSNLGTGPFGEDELPEGTVCIDIRNLVDKGGNNPAVLLEYVHAALAAIEAGSSVVICCDHGISRSNALAVAVLSLYENIPVSEAIQEVLDATNHAEIRLDVLDTIRLALEGSHDASKVNKQRWLLTGSRGYLGSSLVASKPASIELFCPSHHELDLSLGSPAIDIFVKENGITGILHLAAPHVSNTNSSVGEAIAAFRNILDVCASNNLSLLLPSRWEVFAGYKGIDLVADESTPLKPSGVLGDTKYLMESLADVFVQRTGMKVTVLRSALVYGGASAPNFIRSFVKRAMHGEKIHTHKYLNGEPELDLIYVDDWVNACWSVLQNELVGLYHCGAGKLFNTREIAEMVVNNVDVKTELDQIEVHEAVANVTLSSKKLEQSVGWVPKVAFSDGLSAYISACTYS